MVDFTLERQVLQALKFLPGKTVCSDFNLLLLQQITTFKKNNYTLVHPDRQIFYWMLS